MVSSLCAASEEWYLETNKEARYPPSFGDCKIFLEIYTDIFLEKMCGSGGSDVFLFPIIPSLYHSIKMHQIRDGDFADFTAFADYFFQCFQSSAFLRISEVSSFSHSNYRERNAEKNAYKITLTEHQREMQKNCLHLL